MPEKQVGIHAQVAVDQAEHIRTLAPKRILH